MPPPTLNYEKPVWCRSLPRTRPVSRARRRGRSGIRPTLRARSTLWARGWATLWRLWL